MHCVAKRYITCGPFIRTELDHAEQRTRIVYRIDDVDDPDATHQYKVATLTTPLVEEADDHPRDGDWIIESEDHVDWMPEHEFRQKYTIIGE